MTQTSVDAFPFVPLVIIGAARSGTNALRDVLTRLPGFSTWPCDEINPIWRHGNLTWPNDEIPVERATPVVRRSVRAAFTRIWRQQGRPQFVVEKTCANALRVPFVEAVLPEARFVHIVRNGFDTVASAQKRWQGELEMPGLPYYLAKARYAPLSDLPRYAFFALSNRLAIRLGQKERFSSWGPRFAGLDAFADRPLDEIVARQWAACVTSSDDAFAKMDADRVFRVRYEDFAEAPENTAQQLLEWLGETRAAETITDAASIVRGDSVGKGKAQAKALSATVRQVLEAPMRAHGYL